MAVLKFIVFIFVVVLTIAVLWQTFSFGNYFLAAFICVDMLLWQDSKLKDYKSVPFPFLLSLAIAFVWQAFSIGSYFLAAFVGIDILLWQESRKQKQKSALFSNETVFQWDIKVSSENYTQEIWTTPEFFLYPEIKVHVEALLQENFFYIYVYRTQPQFTPSKLCCEICLIDDGQEKFMSKKTIKLQRENNPVLFATWKTEEMDDFQRFKDKITIRCKLSTGKVNVMNIETTLVTDLSSDLTDLLESATHADIILNVGEEQIPAHKAILSARSKVFAAMFQPEMVDKDHDSAFINDVKPSTFKLLLQYIYSGSVPEASSIESIDELYAAADKYAILGLKRSCLQQMLQGLSVDNAYSYLKVADRHDDHELKQGVIQFFLTHDDFFLDSKWINFSNKNPLLAVEVLNIYIKSKLFRPSRNTKQLEKFATN